MIDWPPFVWIAVIAGALYGLHLIIQHAIKPTWRFLVALVKFVEATSVLLDIAEEFKPNHGQSMRDVVNRIEYNQGGITARVERIETHLGIKDD